MVVKTKLLFIIGIVSGFLLTLELITLQVIVHRGRPDSHPIWRTLYAVTTTGDSIGINSFLVDSILLQKIAQIAKDDERNHKTKQQTASSTTPIKSDHSYCKILCRGQKVTHLATLGEFFDQYKLKKWKKLLEDKGYTFIVVTDDRKASPPPFPPTSARPSASVIWTREHHHHQVDGAKEPSSHEQSSPFMSPLKTPTVCQIVILDEKLPPKEGHVVIVSIFYDKLHDNWMRGPLVLTDIEERLIYRQGVRKPDIKDLETATLYVKTPVRAMIMDGMLINLPKNTEIFTNSYEELEYVECNRSLAREFHDRFPYSEHEMELNRLFRLKVRRILFSTQKILDSLKIPWWISSGTLLGYYRQCDVIHYSFDVDIGVFASDYKDGLIEAFQMNDLPIMHIFGRPKDSFELSFRNEDTKLDIFFFYREGDKIWNGGTSTSTAFKYKYTFPKFNLCWTDFLDLKVRIPCPTLPYILANYGPDWFTPKTEWDWKTSPPNVSPNGQWPMEEWPEVIQSFSIPGVL